MQLSAVCAAAAVSAPPQRERDSQTTPVLSLSDTSDSGPAQRQVREDSDKHRKVVLK